MSVALQSGLYPLPEITLPDAVTADGDIGYPVTAGHVTQEHKAGNQRVDALRLVAQDQIGCVLIRFAELVRQQFQLFSGETAAAVRQAQSIPSWVSRPCST